MGHIKLILAGAILLVVAGCTVTKYAEDAGGRVTFSRSSFLNMSKVARLERTTNGLVLEGYINDQVSGAAEIAKAAVEGAVKGAK